MEINLTTQWYRNKLRDEISNLSPEERCILFIKLYKEHVELKRLMGLFKCTMNDIKWLLEREGIKRCNKCKQIKSRSIKYFWSHEGIEGLNSICIECELEKQRNPKKKLIQQAKRKVYNQRLDVKQKNADYMCKRKHNNNYFRLRSNISTRMANSLKKYSKGYISKNGYSWEDLVEYTVEELIAHLESQFQFGMSWDNYGKWHVDHIKPISSFNLIDVTNDDFRKCWQLSNLQPLWAIDNLKKSNKYIDEDIV